MFDTNYYCLVAGLREYSLDGGAKGFDPHAILDEILRELTPRDLRAVRLLYGYYDCKNLIALRAGSPAHDPLGNFARERLKEETEHPAPAAARDRTGAGGLCPPRRGGGRGGGYLAPLRTGAFRSLLRTVRRVAEPFPARVERFRPHAAQRRGGHDGPCRGASRRRHVVGNDDVAEQLRRSSASDFGLRGELPYIDAVIAAVNDESNLLEKEHKIDRIRWQQAVDLVAEDYFNVNAVLSYLVRINLVARWTQLDEARGRAMLGRLLRELDGKELINNK